MMHQIKIKRISGFKDAAADLKQFNRWVSKLELSNDRFYERQVVHTSLGKTHVWGFNTEHPDQKALVIFPGARTTALFWDLDKGLDHLGPDISIFMVETNGLPNLSDGNTPDIHSNDYGYWASEVLGKLNIHRAFVAGASFGGLVAMKLATVSPETIQAIFLLNPGCLQSFSMRWKNLWNNILPIVSPTRKHVMTFLNNAIFCKPNHRLSEHAEEMLIEYELLALRRYQDRTQKPYAMRSQLSDIPSPVYLLEGDHDLLFPYEKSIQRAKQHLRNLQEVKVFRDVGHGIETFAPAMAYIREKIELHTNHRNSQDTE